VSEVDVDGMYSDDPETYQPVVTAVPSRPANVVVAAVEVAAAAVV